MKRRKFIIASAAAAVLPLRAQAQSPPPIVGFLNGGSLEVLKPLFEGFRRGLTETGLVEGRNFIIEPHWANGDSSKLPIIAADLVRRKVAVIIAGGPPATRAAMAATSSIPIIFSSGEDPVKAGFVASLARPGANVTTDRIDRNS